MDVKKFMTKRNIILIAVIILLVIAILFGFAYFFQSKTQPAGTTSGTNFWASFLPFGKSNPVTPENNGTTDVSGYTPASDATQAENRLQKVSTFPVAGYGVFMKERFKEVIRDTGGQKPAPPTTEFAPALRYINKATGNIYQTFADKIDERKFSSVVVPKVYEAYFGNGGNSVVVRYLKDDGKTVETYVGTLQKEYLGADSVGNNTLTGSFLPENISSISISPDSNKLFYLFGVSGSSIGVSYSLQNSTKVQIFESPFTEWLPVWAKGSIITLTTKPSSDVPGYMYVINPDRKDFNKVLGGINGLTTLASPDGKLVLYSDSSLSLYIFNTETRDSTSLGINTLPDKCVWNNSGEEVYCAVPRFIPDGSYPDSWYQGEVSFSDQIWRIDARSGNTSMLADPLSIAGNADIDGVNLSLDNKENFLFLINKKDSYLWELKLK